jgi:hypothetical protein
MESASSPNAALGMSRAAASWAAPPSLATYMFIVAVPNPVSTVWIMSLGESVALVRRPSVR